MKTVNKFGTINEVLERFPDINYVVVWRHNDEIGFSEFVAARAYDETDGTWGSGSYFHSLVSAMDYIKDIYERKFGEEAE